MALRFVHFSRHREIRGPNPLKQGSNASVTRQTCTWNYPDQKTLGGINCVILEGPICRVRKRGLLEKGSFQKSRFSRDSREFRESRDSREPPDCGKGRRIRPFSRDSREFRDFRDSRDSSGEKTPFVMTPFSVPRIWGPKKSYNSKDSSYSHYSQNKGF